LRRAATRWVPRNVAARKKRRFMTPFGTPFVGPNVPELIREMLDPGILAAYGYFDPRKVASAIRRLEYLGANKPRWKSPSFLMERLALGMAITLVVSTQLFHQLLVLRQEHIRSDRVYGGRS
jgi:asparagine synthase (glutamine-hydrolysing)